VSVPAADSKAGVLDGWRYHALVLSILLSAIGYLAVSLWGGWREVVGAVAQVGILGFGIALGLSLVNYGLRFLRWQYYLDLLGHQVPWRASLRIYISGFALTTTPGKAGEMVRSVFLRRHGVGYAESVAAFFAERTADLIAVVLIAAIGVWSHHVVRPWLLGVGGFMLLVLLVLQNKRWLRLLRVWGRSLAHRRLRRLLLSSLDMVLHYRRLFTIDALSVAMLLGLFAWVAEAYAFYLVAVWMGGDLSLSEAFFIYAFAMLVGALTFLPGGLGSAEVVMVGLLLVNGMSEPAAVACTLLVRVATLWFAVVLGLMSLPRRV
jgi:uncharacterized protein (TIRG00374 family)